METVSLIQPQPLPMVAAQPGVPATLRLWRLAEALTKLPLPSRAPPANRTCALSPPNRAAHVFQRASVTNAGTIQREEDRTCGQVDRGRHATLGGRP